MSIGRIMGPNVTFVQGPIVTNTLVTFGPMEELDPQMAAFASRMSEICDDKAIAAGHGRQTALAAVFQVTPKAARKWLQGMGYPEMKMAVRIADWADVNLNWLLQGIGPKRGSRVDHKAMVLDEAVRLLPREIGLDLIDNLRAKLERMGKLSPDDPVVRYRVMLDAYEQELGKRRPN